MSTTVTADITRVARPQAGQVQLTRRGRLVVLAVALLLVLAVGVALGGGSAATSDAGAETTVVVVDRGDTLWGIASEYAPEGVAVRSMMTEIEQINRLDSPMLMLGQRLHVPVQG